MSIRYGDTREALRINILNYLTERGLTIDNVQEAEYILKPSPDSDSVLVTRTLSDGIVKGDQGVLLVMFTTDNFDQLAPDVEYTNCLRIRMNNQTGWMYPDWKYTRMRQIHFRDNCFDT